MRLRYLQISHEMVFNAHVRQLTCLFNRPFPSYVMPLFQSEVFKQNLSYENKVDLYENEPVGGTNFHVKCFALRLVLIEAQENSEMAY